MFCVELIASSFLDLISKQARLTATVSTFLLLMNYVISEIYVPFYVILSRPWFISNGLHPMKCLCRSKAGEGYFLEATLVVAEVCVSLICKTAVTSDPIATSTFFGKITKYFPEHQLQEKWNVLINSSEEHK